MCPRYWQPLAVRRKPFAAAITNIDIERVNAGRRAGRHAYKRPRPAAPQSLDRLGIAAGRLWPARAGGNFGRMAEKNWQAKLSCHAQGGADSIIGYRRPPPARWPMHRGIAFAIA
jgi:hypothetical protein